MPKRSSSEEPEGTALPAAGTDPLRQRAANAFWNGAGDYSAAPPRLFATDTDPCLYENLATGLMCRCYGTRRITALFASWEDDHRADRLDEVAWLVCERGAYLSERGDRPALDALRGRFLSGLSPSEREAHARIERLDVGELATFDQVQAEISRLQRALCGFDGTVVRTPTPTLHLGVSILSLTTRERKRSERERLFVHRAFAPGEDRGAGSRGERSGAGKGTARERRAAQREAADRAFVESCFGPLACSREKLAGLERRVCTGAHAGCRLWVADAGHAPSPAGSRELRELRARAEEQLRENRAFHDSRRGHFESIAEAISRHLRDALATASHIREPRHSSGRLDASRGWRAGTLDDARVFSRRMSTTGADVSLDLLLDASGSRSALQAEIATQAYVIGRAFSLCGVPVRVSAFSTVRNHTVLRVFNEYGKSSELSNVFRYYASGFNRDGLALRAAGGLVRDGLAPLKASVARNRLLIVLTDAAPMDEQAVNAPGSELDGRSYAGRLAVADTAQAVRGLRDAGLRVAALYSAGSDFLHDAKTIYGADLVRIERIDQMAAGTCALIDRLLH